MSDDDVKYTARLACIRADLLGILHICGLEPGGALDIEGDLARVRRYIETMQPHVVPVVTDDVVLAALTASVADNPTGASATDVLFHLGTGPAVNAALQRLEAAGKAAQTSPGNYLPKRDDEKETSR